MAAYSWKAKTYLHAASHFQAHEISLGFLNVTQML